MNTLAFVALLVVAVVGSLGASLYGIHRGRLMLAAAFLGVTVGSLMHLTVGWLL